MMFSREILYEIHYETVSFMLPPEEINEYMSLEKSQFLEQVEERITYEENSFRNGLISGDTVLDRSSRWKWAYHAWCNVAARFENIDGDGNNTPGEFFATEMEEANNNEDKSLLTGYIEYLLGTDMP